MCFGYDGEGALRQSLEQKGASRRSLLRGAAAGAAGVAAIGSGVGLAVPAQADGGHGGHGKRSVRHDDISIQLYTLRSAMQNRAGYDLVLTRLAQYGYEKVELAGYGDRTAAELADRLEEVGIRATSSHEGISTTSAAMHTKFQNAVTLGQKYVVVPYLREPNTPDQWKAWADQMNAEAAAARRYGLRYGYHNHAHEFVPFTGTTTTPWEILTDRLDPRLVHLEVDIYWAYTGGVETGASDPLQFAIDVIDEAPQKVRQYHVKDRDGATGDMADLGTGVIDFTKVFRSHRVEEYIVENDTPDVTPLTSAAVGHGYLEHLRY